MHAGLVQRRPRCCRVRDEGRASIVRVQQARGGHGGELGQPVAQQAAQRLVGIQHVPGFAEQRDASWSEVEQVGEPPARALLPGTGFGLITGDLWMKPRTLPSGDFCAVITTWAQNRVPSRRMHQPSSTCLPNSAA